MNAEKNPEPNVQTLLDLRKEVDALRLITERLKVKDMGPADHIRTKHEVKTFIENGSDVVAEALLERAAARREVSQKITAVQNRRQRQAP